MKSFSRRVKNIFYEFKNLYLGIGIVYLILLINVIPKLIKEFKNLTPDTPVEDIVYLSISLFAYVCITILYFMLAVASSSASSHYSHSSSSSLTKTLTKSRR